MVAPPIAATSATISRLRREDHHRTKHDSSFSKWLVLIGPCDWENHQVGKEGAERYRVGNLPAVSGPGLYEIGVAVCPVESGRDLGKIQTDRIVVVYLGQAENVRSRLQHYGRSGSHLVHAHDQSTALFNDIFFRGFPIVYRWALTECKSEAERTETELLEKFDYAWNKVGNGGRRPNDVLGKIEKIASRNYNISKIMKMFRSIGETKVGIPIKANKPSHDTDAQQSFNFFNRVLKFGRSQPRVVSANPHETVNKLSQICVCGVTLSNGSICSKSPVGGRKRCAEHKGRRITSRTTNLILARSEGEDFQSTAPKNINNVWVDSDVAALTPTRIDPYFDAKSVADEYFSPTCGVIIHQLDGSVSPCTKPPVSGRRRCLEHRGMRINHIISSSAISFSKPDVNGYCGVDLDDQKSCCMAQPVKGRKRCEKHKGMKVVHPQVMSTS